MKLCEQSMPRDVATRWNSTFDMLEFTIKYQQAIDAINGECELNLRNFELTEEEWTTISQLKDVLKVSDPKAMGTQHAHADQIHLQLFLTHYPQSHHCAPCNGPH